MKNRIYEIIAIITLCIFIGISRSLIFQDISIIKYPPKVIELLPERLSEPMLINLELCKKLFYEGAIFIDSRDSLSFSSGHIEDSINIPWESYNDDEINSSLNDIPYDKNLIIYCSGGDCTLSIDLSEYIFNELAFEKVFIFEGGYPLWVENNLPIKQYCNKDSIRINDENCIYVE